MNYSKLTWNEVLNNNNINLLEHPVYGGLIEKDEFQKEFGLLLEELNGEDEYPTPDCYFGFFMESNPCMTTSLKFIGEDIFPIEQVRQKMSRSINIRFPFNAEGNGHIDQLISLAQTHKGSCSLIVHLMSSRGQTQRIRSRKLRVTSSQEFMKKLRDSFGETNVWIS